MQAGRKAAADCIKVFSETDQTDDLKRIDVPTLISRRFRLNTNVPERRMTQSTRGIDA